jgi:DNA-directed RNA polymerase specialized sigma24 family protein
MSYELKKSQEVESDIMHVALLHRKVNDGRLQQPISFRIQFHDSGAVTVASEPLEDVPDFVEELPIADQCVLALREHGPRSVKELVEITGLQSRSVSVVLSRNRSRFRRIGNQQWDAVD